MQFFKKYYGLLFVILLSLWTIKTFFATGFFPMHDDTQVARVYEMGKALKDGMFPVRWVQDLGYGYGYPIFNFYAPLAYYFGGFLTLVGINALIATKIMMAAGVILAAISMYLLARELWGEVGAIISSLLFVYAPYHAVDVYVRGDVAEFWAYAFIPLIFYGLIKIYKTTKWKYVIITALGYAGLITSHNLSALMVTPFFLAALAIYLYLGFKNKKRITVYYLLAAVILGLMISAFYWLPVFPEMKYTNVLSQLGGGSDYRDNFVCLSQFWTSQWGFGGSIPGCIDGMSFQIGKLHILLWFISLALFIFCFKKMKKIRSEFIIFSFAASVISLFFALQISQGFWDKISQMAFFQYPWRFLLPISFFISVVAGLPASLLKGKSRLFLAIIIIAAGTYFYPKLFVPQVYLQKDTASYVNAQELKWKVSKISDEYLPKNFIKPESENEIAKEKITIQEGSIKVTSLTDRTQKLRAEMDVLKKARIRLNLAYFPAWVILLDNKSFTFEDKGELIVLDLPVGRHVLEATYIETPVEKLANAVSTVGVLILVLGIIYQWRKAYDHK